MAFDSASAVTTQSTDYPSLLDGRISFEPPPAWAGDLSFDVAAPRQREDALTCLLHHEQVHAEESASFTRIVMRLESMQAVQHLSQWRLNLDPLTERLALHTLRVRRGEVYTEHANPTKVRVLQREEGLEAFVIHGHYTLLTLFEDVRPGDCLEVAYTIFHHPLLFAGRCHRMLMLSGTHAIDRYEWSVLHRPARNLRHLAAPALGAPEISDATGLIRWSWSGSLRERAQPEAHTPPWHLPEHWLQLSDLPDWGTIAAGVAAAWPAGADEAMLVAEARLIEEKTRVKLKRVELALRLVQDEFRYLSVNLEVGGQIPSTPAEVLRRRYGDCKDLTLLLCRLLGLLGVSARPVLIHTQLGPRLPELLPSPGLFNHAVVEFTVNGETRWVDPTVRSQGGGPLGRSIPPFGVGLAVDESATGLLPQPATTPPFGDKLEIHETLLLDTRGASSMLRFRQLLTGHHADALRRQLDISGLKDYHTARTQSLIARYGEAELETPLYRDDDRDRNIIRTIEIYRVRGVVDLARGGGRCTVNLPTSSALLALARPEAGERRAPWFIPYPLNLVHTQEMMANQFAAKARLNQTFHSDAINLTLQRRFLKSRWLQTVSLSTNVASIPAGEVEAYAQTLNTAWTQANWSISAIAGLARSHRRHHFLELLSAPPLQTPGNPKTKDSTPKGGDTDDDSDDDISEDAESAAPFAGNSAANAVPATVILAAKHRGVPVRAGKRKRPISPWMWLVAGFGIAAAVCFYYLYMDRINLTPKVDSSTVPLEKI